MKPNFDPKAKKEKAKPSRDVTKRGDSATQYIDSLESGQSQRESLERALDELSTEEKWIRKALDAATRERKIDQKKIEDLKARIAAGTYQIKSEAIAKKFVEEQLGVKKENDDDEEEKA